MPQQNEIPVNIPNVGKVFFPASMSHQEITEASAKLYREAVANPTSEADRAHLRSILDPLDVPREVKAAAWDAFHEARNDAEFRIKFAGINIPRSAKHDLWDAKRFTPEQLLKPRTKGRVQEAPSVFQPVTDVLAGIGSGVFNSGLGVSKLLGAVPSETTLEDIGMAPTNDLQKAGMAAEQIGEFFLPSGLAGKGAKAVEAATAASRLPTAAKTLLNVGTRAGLEATGAGAVTAVQTGGDVETTRAAAGLSAAIPVAGRVIQPVANVAKTFLSQKLPGRLVESLIKPPKRMKAFGKEPGQEVALQRLKANTLEGLEQEIAQRSDNVGAIIDRMLSTPSAARQRIDIVPLINGPIDDAIRAAKIDGNKALVSRLEELRAGQLTERFNLTTTPKALRVSPLDARRIKTQNGKAFRWSEDPVESSLNDVRQQIYRNINDAIEAKVPGVKAVNRSYGNLLSAGKSVQARIDAANKLNLVGLTSAGLGAATAIATALADGSLGESTVNALLVGGAIRATKNPRLVLGLAGRLAKLTPSEKAMVAKAVPLLRNAYLASPEDEE